jgi:hypothetical protein
MLHERAILTGECRHAAAAGGSGLIGQGSEKQSCATYWKWPNTNDASMFAHWPNDWPAAYVIFVENQHPSRQATDHSWNVITLFICPKEALM